MAHDLFQDSMVYVGDKPWHGLGTKIAASSTAKQFLEAANLDWKVSLDPAPGAKQDKKRRWSRLIISRDAVPPEKDRVALGMVTSRYEPLQNTGAFAFFDPLIASRWASYEAAGALGDGETVWVQVKLRDDMEVQAGDPINRYLLLRNRHNGEGAVSIRFTPIRVVCQNTLTFAEAKTSALANVRHSKAMPDRLLKVQAEVLKSEIEAFSARCSRIFQGMVKAKLTPLETLALLEKLCGAPPKGAPIDGLPARRTLVEERLAAQAEKDPLAGTGTAWALYNAITWAEDERARQRGQKNPEAGLNAIWFGGAADNKAAAFNVLGRVAGALMPA